MKGRREVFVCLCGKRVQRKRGMESGIFRFQLGENDTYLEEGVDGPDANENDSQDTQAGDKVEGTLITTIGEAVEVVLDRMQRQIELAKSSMTPFNVPTHGDGAAKMAFYTLLPVKQQRVLFLQIASSQSSWPRLRSLFGAPPYAFLLPQDASLLNATGIARSRTNMTHEEYKIANYSQFGTGQLLDEYNREYRVVDTTISEHDPLPSSYSSMSVMKQVHLVVRVQRRSIQERIRRLKDTHLRKTISFPATGESISLRETKRMLRFQGRAIESTISTTFKVIQVKPRDANASTAAVLAVRN